GKPLGHQQRLKHFVTHYQAKRFDQTTQALFCFDCFSYEIALAPAWRLIGCQELRREELLL
ncbi:hypothetical protein, partial [Mesorhizobium sp. M2D.F.Ca.ET.223.01.1.1]|uniref:hypothetical protein n=1 Tax=Mesorhizobium sp. M2D.F.Ca.ET.223.01.1.1 TaxID=2563940 RepID=UPI001AEDB4B1